MIWGITLMPAKFAARTRGLWLAVPVDLSRRELFEGTINVTMKIERT